MNNYRKYLLLASIFVGIGSFSGVYAAEGAEVVPPKSKYGCGGILGTAGKYLNKWRGTLGVGLSAFGLAYTYQNNPDMLISGLPYALGAGTAYGYNKVTDVFGRMNQKLDDVAVGVREAAAGVQGAAQDVRGNIDNIVGSPTYQRVRDDIVAQVAVDGVSQVFRVGARAGAEGVGQGMNQELVIPAINDIARRVEPYKENIDGISNFFKGFTWKKTLLVSAGVIALWYGARMVHGYVENYLNKPHLDVVIKKAPMSGTIGTLRRQMIFAPATRDRLNVFLKANLAIKQSIMAGSDGATYRNLLLYGPSGSGKRMYAEEVAHFARMDFHPLPWSLFNKFKDGDATRAIEQFFKHDIKKSEENGAVIFIDNAHILFSNARPAGDTVTAHIINALVKFTENRSNEFLVIFGMSTKPSLARDTMLIVDDIVEITLPALAERKKLLRNYRDLYFRSSEISEEKVTDALTMLDDNTLDNLAQRLDKASAAELAAFMKTLKIESELPASDGLTPELIAQLVSRSENRYDELIA